jgi:SnoaL-like domain
MTSATTTFDLAAHARAIENRDAATLLADYRPDAEIVLVDHDNPPSRPRVLTGLDTIRDHLSDVYGRDMTHQVRTRMATDEQIAFEVACAYPDGTRVLCLCVARIEDGRIASHHQVQAWDS